MGDGAACTALVDRYGADASLKSKSGLTAAEVAEEEGHRHAYLALGSHGGPGPETSAMDVDDGEMKMEQQADGSWKVVYVEKAGGAPATLSAAPSSGTAASAAGVRGWCGVRVCGWAGRAARWCSCGRLVAGSAVLRGARSERRFVAVQSDSTTPVGAS